MKAGFLFDRMRTILDVKTPEGGQYPVLCGSDPAGALAGIWDSSWRQAVLIGDSNTMPLFGTALASSLRELTEELVLLSFPAGERFKTRATKRRLEDAMLSRGVERAACVVAVGGGVVLDLAGFVAATYMRGLAHVNVATTLLAQVDAALGGKTGVNTRRGKNLIGAFHHPRAVLLDLHALRTLSLVDLRAGLAEAVKHAVIADADLFARFEAWSEAGPATGLPEELLVRCVEIKAEAVAADGRDLGRRQALNFGHTAAHAIEAATRHSVSHGEAVAAGMLIEARVAEAVTGFRAEETGRLERLLERLRLPVRAPCSFSAALRHIGLDKKASGRQIRCALPRRLGLMDEAGGRWTCQVPAELLEDCWEAPR